MEQSKMFSSIKEWHDRGLWSNAKVEQAVARGWITQEECNEILSRQ